MREPASKERSMPRTPLIICVFAFVTMTTVFCQELQPRRVSTVTCTIIRKNSCNGFSKVVKGRFFFDAATNRACYEYGAPFGFRFLLSDTNVVGIDMQRNSGYVSGRSRETSCDNLYESIHLFESYLRYVNTDASLLARAGQTDSHTYLACKEASFTDVLARNDETGALDCIETFDEKGGLYQQIKARFNDNESRYDFPVRVVIRKRCSDMITADTVLISNAHVNGILPTDAFKVPEHCRLQPMNKMRQRLFLDGSK
jgi:hypothetical protein